MNETDRRPIKGWEDFYEVTRDGLVWSVRLGRFIEHALDEHNRPYIEVQIGGVRYERGIVQAVEEAWGDVSLVAHLPRHIPELRPDELKLFDHVIGTYQPPARWGASFKRRKPPSPEDLGKRGLFQAVGVVALDDKLPGIGDWKMMPRDVPGFPRFRFHSCPLSHLQMIERAPKEITQPHLHPSAIQGLGSKR